MLAGSAAMIAALATATSSEHLRICREMWEAPHIEQQIDAFRAAKGREPTSIGELVGEGYLPWAPHPPSDRERRPFVLVRGPDGRAYVAREGGAFLATSWECNRGAYAAFSVIALVLLAGVGASLATRKRQFALVAVAVVSAALLVDWCVGPPPPITRVFASR